MFDRAAEGGTRPFVFFVTFVVEIVIRLGSWGLEVGNCRAGGSRRASKARGRDLESHGKPCRQPRAVRHDDQHVLLALMQVEQE